MFQLAADEEVAIAASPHTVWEYRLDFTNLPAYNPAASNILRSCDGTGVGGPLGAGAVYRFDLDLGIGPHEVTLTVTDVLADRAVSAEMNAGLVARETFTVGPHDRGTEPGAGTSKSAASDAEHCIASLKLWIDVPDGTPLEATAQLLEGGRRQIRDELDAINEILSKPPK